jgi:hypothetical protein
MRNKNSKSINQKIQISLPQSSYSRRRGVSICLLLFESLHLKINSKKQVSIDQIEKILYCLLRPSDSFPIENFLYAMFHSGMSVMTNNKGIEVACRDIFRCGKSTKSDDDPVFHFLIVHWDLFLG